VYFLLICRFLSNKLLYHRETGTLEEICKVSTTFLLVNENNIFPMMTIRNKGGLTRSWRKLVSNYQLNAQFLYSVTIFMLHYNPQHFSSCTMLIFRRTNCIITASGIVTFCKQLYSMPVESCPPEDKHSTARNMLRIRM